MSAINNGGQSAHDEVLFDLSCIDYKIYPSNLPRQRTSSKRIRTYHSQLDTQSGDLFSDEARLGFWDFDPEHNEFEHKRTQSLEDVRQLCGGVDPQLSSPPCDNVKCRFIFLHSENSRSGLYSTRAMLMLVLSYHLVNPWFLDFLFMFGRQYTPKDSRFSAFRQQVYNRLEPALSLPKLHRTTEQVHVCYNLRWPETTTTNKYRPWSVRQTVSYSIFDIGSGNVFFIVLKGNDSISKDLREETRKWKWQDSDEEGSLYYAFESYLKTHLFICESSCDTWRHYINYLERRLNEETEDAIRCEVSKRSMWTEPEAKFDQIDLGVRARAWSKLRNLVPRSRGVRAQESGMDHLQNSNAFDIAEKALAEKSWESGLNPVDRRSRGTQIRPDVDFSKLQEATKTDEKVNDGIFALTCNIENMNSLAEQYRCSEHLPKELQEAVPDFTARLIEMVREMSLCRLSLESLQRTFVERKSLVTALLQHRNMEAGEDFASEAQLTSWRMEVMTEEMRQLSRKTKRETLSMSVIAGVTMFYLPGTFVSTLMSTPIVTWNQQADGNYQKHTEAGAWHLFLELTLPLTFLTFVVWILVTWRYNSEDRRLRALKGPI